MTWKWLGSICECLLGILAKRRSEVRNAKPANKDQSFQQLMGHYWKWWHSIKYLRVHPMRICEQQLDMDKSCSNFGFGSRPADFCRYFPKKSMWDKVKHKTIWKLPVWFLCTSWGLSWLLIIDEGVVGASVDLPCIEMDENAKQEKRRVSGIQFKKITVFPMNAKKLQNKHFQRIKAWNLVCIFICIAFSFQLGKPLVPYTFRPTLGLVDFPPCKPTKKIQLGSPSNWSSFPPTSRFESLNMSVSPSCDWSLGGSSQDGRIRG